MMADEPIELAAPTNVVGGQTPEPAAASPVAAPVANPEPVVAAAEPVAAVVEPAPAPAADAPAAVVPEPTLLQKFDAEKPAEPKNPDDKPAAVADKPVVEAIKPAAEGDKPADPAAAAAPAAQEPVAYEYALPETIKLDDTAKTELHTALDAFRADPAKGAQGLIDLHNKSMQEYAEHVGREQHRIFGETRKGWQTQVMADEELGGAGFQTTMGAVARARDLLVPEARRDSFNEMLMVTGVGDHPEFLRLLHSAARIYDEAPMPPPGPRPPADIGKPQGRGLRSMYKSNQGRQ